MFWNLLYQQHAFEIKIVDRVKSTHNFVRLAADLASERERWIQGLLILASIRKEGGFAVQDLLLQGIKPELARKAPELLNFSASVSPPDHDRIKSLLESGYDEDLAKSVLDEEDEVSFPFIFSSVIASDKKSLSGMQLAQNLRKNSSQAPILTFIFAGHSRHAIDIG